MFTPKILIKNINLAADAWTLEDITGDSPTDATGYLQAAYLPQNNTEWTKEVFAQYLGTSPVNVPFTTAGDELLFEAELNYQLNDGVYLITEYFAKTITGLSYTVDPTFKILTKTAGNPWLDPLGLFENVYAVQKGTFSGIANASLVSSLTATTLTLVSAIPTLVANDNLTIIYKATTYVLITSSGSNKLMQQIGDLALSSLDYKGCDEKTASELFKKIALQTSAQIQFNCGNYSKAHNAAILLDNSTENTESCGC